MEINLEDQDEAIVVTWCWDKIREENNLRKKVFILAHSLKLQSILEGKLWQQEEHTGRGGEMTSPAQLKLSYLFSPWLQLFK